MITIFEQYARLEELIFILRYYEETLLPGEETDSLLKMRKYKEDAVKELDRFIRDTGIKNLDVEGILNLIEHSYKQKRRIFKSTAR